MRLVPTVPGADVRWRKRLFGLMARTAGSAPNFFSIPPNRVVELGSAHRVLTRAALRFTSREDLFDPYQGITYTTSEEVVDLGSTQDHRAKKRRRSHCPPILGGLALGGRHRPGHRRRTQVSELMTFARIIH